jgi:hypothetical protein
LNGVAKKTLQKFNEGNPNEENPNEFSECCWILFFRLFSFCVGYNLLQKKPWFYDMKHFWYGYPQPIEQEVFWFVMIGMAFYCAQVSSQIFGPKNDFFWQYIFIICLYISGWVFNFYRVLSIIQVSRDSTEIVYELGKLAKWKKFRKCWIVLTFFLILFWIDGQVFYYLYGIIFNMAVEFPTIMQLDENQSCHSYNIFVILLIGLFVLQVKWICDFGKSIYVAYKNRRQRVVRPKTN